LGSATVEVEYVLRLDDLVALNDYLLEHPHGGTKGGAQSPSWIWLAFMILLALLLVLSISRGEFSFTTVWLAVVVACALVLILLRRRLARRLVRGNVVRLADRNARMLGWRRLTLTPESLIAASQYRTITLAWPGVEKIVISGDRAFIFDSSLMAHV